MIRTHYGMDGYSHGDRRVVPHHELVKAALGLVSALATVLLRRCSDTTRDPSRLPGAR